ncbi:unnamed protein product [Bursaphelenchus okinawaensis]|uniref:7TM_GPCR_Srx domain-containing protein n=1 Tax=Bursaphelenchus okinawaensis TaxID=465554 RepID=A0A811LKP2_9BILA|nr:unnamed protein product [Bursaphelenchus okinawaensis]CAG9124844.1 unnamed protein product [Bursaphelenchus okinawaensis]
MMCYKILFCMSITDLIQLFGHVYTGILCISNQRPSYWREKIIGGAANAAWCVMLSQTMVLALNRWSVIVKHFHSRGKHKKYTFMFNTIATYGYGASFMIVYLTPYCGLKFVSPGYYWEYSDDAWSLIVSEVEFYSTLIIILITLFAYVWIVLHIVNQKNKIIDIANAPASKQEYKILFQGIFLFLFACFQIIIWHCGDILPSPLNGKYTNAGIHTGWVLFCGVTPILNLIMNKDLRTRVLHDLKLPQQATHSDFFSTKVPYFSKTSGAYLR